MKHRQWARAGIFRLKRELEELFLRAEKISETDEIVGDINRYLVIRVCGYIEQSFVLSARSLCESRSGAEGLRFSHSWLDRSPNPRRDELIKLVNRFSETWAEELSALLDVDERGNSLNSLVGIRNDIAHGKNQGVSRIGAWEYFVLANLVVDWFVERCEPIK
jgi:RiboL-PSP-HEPN